MEGCIHHTQKGDKHGYGRKLYQGRLVNYHRAVYMETHKLDHAVLEGLVVRHTCDNPRCINPAHLIQGTVADNQRDMAERKRSQIGERNPCAKINKETAEAINAAVGSQRTIAKSFGVSQATVSLIKSGKIWSK